MANANNICLDKFVEEIKRELSVSCLLPIQMPNAGIYQIIERAKQWFYKNYEDSVEEKYYVIDESTWSTSTFISTKIVELPEGIISVHGVHEQGKEGFHSKGFAGLDSDFALDKFIYKDIYRPALQSDNMMYYVIHESLYDLARQIFINKLSYSYNRLNKKLRFLGDIPKRHVILEVFQTIDDCSLFKDEIFYRWIVAHCKIQLSRVLGTFQYNLPGNITINYDLIRDEGQTEIENIKTEIKDDEGSDFFLTS